MNFLVDKFKSVKIQSNFYDDKKLVKVLLIY